MIEIEEITKGIAAYRYEQNVILRILRKRGNFSQDEFDKWFRGRELKRHVPLRGMGITGDSYLLGIGVNGFSDWATYIDLIQHMIAINLIDAKTVDKKVIYSLPVAGVPGEQPKEVANVR